MGASFKNIYNLAVVVRRGLLPPRAAVLDFGAQQLLWAPEQLDQMAGLLAAMSAFNGAPETPWENVLAEIGSGSFIGDVFERCGFSYAAVDICIGKNIIPFDLNTDGVPESLRNSFDLVTNFGTTEHVLNQLNCFRTMHHLTSPNGLMYHDLPMGGYFFHGYFSYTPLLFIQLAKANDYEVIYRHYSKAPGAAEPADVTAPPELSEHGWPDGWYQDVGIEFIFRKTSAQLFRVPVEIGTSMELQAAFLEGKGPEFRAIAGAADPQTGEPIPDQRGQRHP